MFKKLAMVLASAALVAALGTRLPQPSLAASSSCVQTPSIIQFKVSYSNIDENNWWPVYTVTVDAHGYSGDLTIDGDPGGSYGTSFVHQYKFIEQFEYSANLQAPGNSYTATLVVTTACGKASKSVRVTIPSGNPTSERTLVAMGDSYSSGEGNPPFTVDEACHTSLYAWPYLVGEANNYTVKDIACSGARLDALMHAYRGRDQQNFQMGFLGAAAVTITIGGNDIGFSPILRGCFRPVIDCMSNSQFAAVQKRINDLRPQLAAALQGMKRFADGAPIYLVGYPRIFSTGKIVRCWWLSSHERARLNSLSAQADTMERQAATNAGVHYISVLNALKDHELCSPESWMYPLGRTPIAYEGHPTRQGQQAIADIVRKHIK